MLSVVCRLHFVECWMLCFVCSVSVKIWGVRYSSVFEFQISNFEFQLNFKTLKMRNTYGNKTPKKINPSGAAVCWILLQLNAFINIVTLISSGEKLD